MIKKILIPVLLIITIGFGLIRVLSNASSMERGHHFSFDNQLGIEIDSLEITVETLKTIIQAGSDSTRDLEGNIDVPKQGYPHEVTIKIYAIDKSFSLKADSFNCYNCDGNHLCTLKATGAEYKFLN